MTYSTNPYPPKARVTTRRAGTDRYHSLCICPRPKRRRYAYIVIDLYTRMAYAEVHSRILPGLAAHAVLQARNKFGFDFAMAQADNGQEFGQYFAKRLTKQGAAVRHSRLGRPDDNAHTERFNRTIQEERLGRQLTYKATRTQ